MKKIMFLFLFIMIVVGVVGEDNANNAKKMRSIALPEIYILKLSNLALQQRLIEQARSQLVHEICESVNMKYCQVDNNFTTITEIESPTPILRTIK